MVCGELDPAEPPPPHATSSASATIENVVRILITLQLRELCAPNVGAPLKNGRAFRYGRFDQWAFWRAAFI